MFFKKPTGLLGIDISSTSVKLLELASQSGGYKVKSCGIVPLAPNAVVDKDIKHIDVVGDAIRQLVKKTRPGTKFAACAVGGSSVITKVVQMPADLNEDELEGQIEAEADRYISHSIEEVNLHFEVIGSNASDPELNDVLLAACRSENVDLYIEALEMGGLQGRVVDVQSYALERAFTLVAPQIPGQGIDESIALVDIGANTTTFCVLRDGKIVYARDQAIGGQKLTEEIQRKYGMSFEEAEIAKREGGLPDDYVDSVLMPFAEALVAQISRGLQFFFSASQFTEVNHVILCGGSAQLMNLREFVEGKVGAPVMIANPFENIAVGGKLSKFVSENAASLMVASGLALRSFD